MKKILFTCLMILISAGLVSANPGISVTVTPVVDTVPPEGGIATYIVKVESITTETETVNLSITDPRTGWTYVFGDNNFEIYGGETKYVDLSINVPSTMSGDYDFTVLGEAYWMGMWWESSDFTSYVHVKEVSVPEFPAAAVPLAIMILVPAFVCLLIRKR